MNTISESAPLWRTNTELAVLSSVTQGEDIPKVGDPEEADGFKVFGDDGFTFLDFIDIINPLQHIPIVGTLYREMTDDTLDPASRVVGGTLFLGPLGTASALANVLVDEATGKDMGEHVLAFFEDAGPDQPQVSGTAPKPVAVAAAPASKTVSSYSAVSTTPVPSAGVETMDPVTAWAMAENSYRQSAAGQVPVSDNTAKGKPGIQRTNLSVSQTTTVAEWARAEASYRKAAAKARPTPTTGAKPETALAPGWKNASPYAAISSSVSASAPVSSPISSPRASRASAGVPARDFGALAALRKDLLAGGRPAMARAASTARETGQRTASIAAASYARHQPAPAKQTNPAPARSMASPAAGAIASEGGWFSDTMLSALGKYDESDKLARRAAAPAR